jgi:WD40 repeat protein
LNFFYINNPAGDNSFINEFYYDRLELRRTINLKQSGKLFVSNQERNLFILGNNSVCLYKNAALTTEKCCNQILTVNLELLFIFKNTRRFLTVGSNKSIILWDLLTLSAIHEVPFLESFASIQFSEDETMFVIISNYNRSCNLFKIEANSITKMWNIKADGKEFLSTTFFGKTNHKLFICLRDITGDVIQTSFQQFDLISGKILGVPRNFPSAEYVIFNI